MLRRAREGDEPLLQDIERAAGRLFADLDMTAIADDEPLTVEELSTYVAAGRAWVATDPDVDEPVAYLLLDIVDGAAHVEQVSVHPARAHQGLGRSLLEHAGTWAAGRQLPALTLTTFADVPWNAPYYARLGFRVLADADLGPQLQRIRAREAELGLDRWPRVAMRRALVRGGEEGSGASG